MPGLRRLTLPTCLLFTGCSGGEAPPDTTVAVVRAPEPPAVITAVDSWTAIQHGDVVRGTLALDAFSTTLLAIVLADAGCSEDACLDEVVGAAIRARFGDGALAGEDCMAASWGESSSRPGLLLVQMECGEFTTGVFVDPGQNVFELRLPFAIDAGGEQDEIAADFMNSVLTEDYASAFDLLQPASQAQIVRFATDRSCPPEAACFAEIRDLVLLTWVAALLANRALHDAGTVTACVADRNSPLGDVVGVTPLSCGGFHPALLLLEVDAAWRVDVDFRGRQDEAPEEPGAETPSM